MRTIWLLCQISYPSARDGDPIPFTYVMRGYDSQSEAQFELDLLDSAEGDNEEFEDDVQPPHYALIPITLIDRPSLWPTAGDVVTDLALMVTAIIATYVVLTYLV